MSITKMRLSDKNVCKVTFTVPSNISETAKKVYLVGEFNNWDSWFGNEEKKREVHHYT